MLSCIQLFATLWTLPQQVPLSMEFPRLEYWSELPFLPLRELTDPGIKHWSLLRPLHWQTNSLPLCHMGSPASCTVSQFFFFWTHEVEREVLFTDHLESFNRNMESASEPKRIGLTSCHFHDFCFFSRRCLVVRVIIHNKLRFLRGGTGVLSAPGSW